MPPRRERRALPASLAAVLVLLALARPAAAAGVQAWTDCATLAAANSDLRAECSAARSLYLALGRRPASWGDSIANGDSYCDFAGISCGVVNGKGTVTGLALSGAGISGFIPAVIGNFLNLETVDLSGNGHRGAIPISIGRLSKLTTLMLQDNQLQGSIPSSIGLCESLVEVNLDNNQALSGTLPATLARLPSLQTFSAQNCALVGPLPAAIGQSTSITSLLLSNNTIGSTIPGPLGNISTLQVLDLSMNRLTGTVPSSFGSLQSLAVLNLNNNSLSAFDPGFPCSFAGFGGLGCALNAFATSGACVKGCLAATLGAPCGLPTCPASSCTAAGATGSDNAGDCTALRALFAAWGSAPAAWASGVTQGTSYCVWDPSSIVCDDYGRVTALLLSDYGLSGGIPASIAGLSALTSLDLSLNQLSSSIPASLAGLSPTLQSLSLASNLLSGTIAPELGSLSLLTVLDLSSNLLNGSLPTALTSLRNLKTFDVSSNFISGALAGDIANWQQLTKLSLASNLMSGTIPKTIGNLTLLAAEGEIDLSGNLFTAFSRNISCDWAPVALSCGDNAFGCTGDASWCLAVSNSTYTGALVQCGVGLCAPPPVQPDFKNNPTTVAACSYLGSNLVNAGDCSAMRAAFAAFNERPASWATGYLTGAPFCTWDTATLKCDSNGRVQELIFDGTLDLGGTITPALRLANRLTRLTITNNANLTGSIPEAIFREATLITYVAIHDNPGIGGLIPGTLGALRNLTHLEMQNQELQGSIPAGLGTTRLRYLDLSSNQLSSTVPGTFVGLVNVTEVYLNDNNLSGFPSSALAGMQSLTILDVSDNLLSGSFAVPTAPMPNLATVDFSLNNLTSIPAVGLGNYTGLSALNLAFNAIAGSVPKEIATITALATFNVENNSLTGWDGGLSCDYQPSDFLCANNLFATSGGGIGACAKACHQWATAVCGVPQCPAPQCTAAGAVGANNGGDCAALRALYSGFANTPASWSTGVNQGTDYCTWDGVGCDDFGRVITLSLAGLGLAGSISSAIGSLPLLTSLDMSGNPALSGAVPPQIGSLTLLTSLTLASCNISGQLPATLQNLVALTALDLSSNAISGFIPYLGSLQSLLTLDLSNNQLTNGIPVWFGTMARLVTLLLNGNQLVGQIPDAIRGAMALERFAVDNNQLTGVLTASVGKLTNLASLTLTGNRFRSWDPAFDCSWAGIADFSCGDNKWACVSATWCLLSVVQGMDASCAQVCASPSGRRRQLIGRDGGGAT